MLIFIRRKFALINAYPKFCSFHSNFQDYMQIKQLKNKNNFFFRTIHEKFPVIYIGKSLSSQKEENIRDANLMFPPIKKVLEIPNSTQSATLKQKQRNIKLRAESSEQEKINKDIQKLKSEEERLCQQEKKLSNECSDLKKQLKEAKQTNNQKREIGCRMDIQSIVQQMKCLGKNRSEVRHKIQRLQNKLLALQNSKI